MDEELANLAAEMAGDIDPTNNTFNNEPVVESDDLAEAEELLKTEEEEADEVVEADEEVKPEAEDEEEAEVEEEVEEEVEAEVEEDKEEVSEEESHKVTIDGEELSVSLQELKDNYSGKQSYDKKFQELSAQRESHDAVVNKFNDNAKNFQTLVSEGKAQEALDFVLEVAGLDRNQFVEAYVSQLAPTISEYLDLSPEEREQRALKQQSDYYKSQYEANQKNQADQAAALQQRSAVEGVLKEHSIDVSRFEKLQKELIEFGVENLTPEAVGQYHVMITQQDVAVDVLKEINPDLVKDKSAMDYLLSLQQNNPDMKKEDLKAKAEKAFIDALSDRVKRDSKAAKPRKKGASKKTKEKVLEDILTFDDLENINLLDL